MNVLLWLVGSFITCFVHLTYYLKLHKPIKVQLEILVHLTNQVIFMYVVSILLYFSLCVVSFIFHLDKMLLRLKRSDRVCQSDLLTLFTVRKSFHTADIIKTRFTLKTTKTKRVELIGHFSFD